MRPVVFLGPSLDHKAARNILDADYRPPVSLGDVCELVVDRKPPDVIAIVDGLFEQVPTVWHKEILYALSRGVRVYGASSMGAIRAAELHTFGMAGVGRIFEWFRDGECEDDDEVAIVHADAEDGYRPLSEAMVNLRYGIEQAILAGVLPHAVSDTLLDAAKEMFYPDRSWPAVFRAGAQRGIPDDVLGQLRDFVRGTRPDLKREDAQAVLRTIAQLPPDGPAPAVGFTFERTYYWQKLVAIVRGQRAARAVAGLLGTDSEAANGGLPLERIAECHPDLLRDSLLDMLVLRESQRLGLLDTPSAVAGDWRARQRVRETLTHHYRTDLMRFVGDRLTMADVDTNAPTVPPPQKNTDAMSLRATGRSE